MQRSVSQGESRLISSGFLDGKSSFKGLGKMTKRIRIRRSPIHQTNPLRPSPILQLNEWNPIQLHTSSRSFDTYFRLPFHWSVIFFQLAQVTVEFPNVRVVRDLNANHPLMSVRRHCVALVILVMLIVRTIPKISGRVSSTLHSVRSQSTDELSVAEPRRSHRSICWTSVSVRHTCLSMYLVFKSSRRWYAWIMSSVSPQSALV